MSNKKVWEPCPRCGSNRVQSRGGCFMAIMGLGIMSVGLWILIIPVLGWIAGPLAMLLGLIILITSPLAKNDLQCQDCHNTWKYPSQPGAEQDN
ncbi:MAG: hypothetical protein BWY70_01594 [Bacteroidetes bacterium ADurb.Bin408]|nr:MAG: hypothetical protein BWY70_01594 [Bacteroidetes bacterium ADurb.Bin408]